MVIKAEGAEGPGRCEACACVKGDSPVLVWGGAGLRKGSVTANASHIFNPSQKTSKDSVRLCDFTAAPSPAEGLSPQQAHALLPRPSCPNRLLWHPWGWGDLHSHSRGHTCPRLFPPAAGPRRMGETSGEGRRGRRMGERGSVWEEAVPPRACPLAGWTARV